MANMRHGGRGAQKCLPSSQGHTTGVPRQRIPIEGDGVGTRRIDGTDDALTRLVEVKSGSRGERSPPGPPRSFSKHLVQEMKVMFGTIEKDGNTEPLVGYIPESDEEMHALLDKAVADEEAELPSENGSSDSQDS